MAYELRSFLWTLSGPLGRLYKPPPRTSSIREVEEYTLWAATCAVASAVSADTETTNAPSQADVADGTESTSPWSTTRNPTMLSKCSNNGDRNVDAGFKIEYQDQFNSSLMNFMQSNSHDPKAFLKLKVTYKNTLLEQTEKHHKDHINEYVWTSNGQAFENSTSVTVKPLLFVLSQYGQSTPLKHSREILRETPLLEHDVAEAVRL